MHHCLEVNPRFALVPALLWIALALGCAAPPPKVETLPRFQPTAEALRESAIEGKDSQVRRILAADQKLVDSPDAQGNTALIMAAGRHGRRYVVDVSQHSQSVRTLLELGADVNAVNANGITPLIAVVSFPMVPKGVQVSLNGEPFARYLDRVQLQSLQHILAKKPNINARDRFGRTPLYYTALAGRIEMARLLLANGADRSLPANDGTTALEIARKQGHDSIATLLSQPPS